MGGAASTFVSTSLNLLYLVVGVSLQVAQLVSPLWEGVYTAAMGGGASKQKMPEGDIADGEGATGGKTKGKKSTKKAKKEGKKGKKGKRKKGEEDLPPPPDVSVDDLEAGRIVAEIEEAESDHEPETPPKPKPPRRRRPDVANRGR